MFTQEKSIIWLRLLRRRLLRLLCRKRPDYEEEYDGEEYDDGEDDNESNASEESAVEVGDPHSLAADVEEVLRDTHVPYSMRWWSHEMQLRVYQAENKKVTADLAEGTSLVPRLLPLKVLQRIGKKRGRQFHITSSSKN